MDRNLAISLLKGGPAGIRRWNVLRAEEPFEGPGLNLREVDLATAQIHHDIPFGYRIQGANLRDVSFAGADLRKADLRFADLSGADFYRAKLQGAKFFMANLSNTGLGYCQLAYADFLYAKIHAPLLEETDFSNAIFGHTTITATDLSRAKGLDSARIDGPCEIGLDSLIRCKTLPLVFLRGCGVPETLIHSLPSIMGAIEPIQFYSCFISHSSHDKDFARRVFSRMRDEGLRVWLDEEDIQGGTKLHEQIDEAILLYDKLLLVLSPESMNSEWVKTEIRKARKAEIKEGKRKLFPIRLVDFNTIREWECFDADSGKDLGVEIREYYIPDFSGAIAPVPRISTKSGPFSPGEWLESLPGSARGY